MRKLLISLFLVIATPGWSDAALRQITVTGEGRVEAVPDMATVIMGVVTEGDTGAEAMSANSAALAQVFARLRAAGVEERDMQTSNLSLSPRWDNRSSSISGQPQIVGFVASNTVSVRLRDLAQVGTVLDAVVQSGANSFQGISFGLQNPQPVQDEARQKAVRDAIRKARLYAEAAGVELGDIQRITENGGGSPRPVMMAMEADMVRSAAVPVAQGEVSLHASVTVVFAIGQ